MRYFIPFFVFLFGHFQLAIGQCNYQASVTVNAVSCGTGEDGTATIDLTNFQFPGSYTFSQGSTESGPINSSPLVIDSLASGNYEITLMDNTGCDTTFTFFVRQSASNIAIQVSSRVRPNCGASDGSIGITAFGGQGPYTYSWGANTGNQLTATAVNLASGFYEVTVTDQNNCSSSISVSLSGQLDASIISLSQNCDSIGQASLEATSMGGTGPYTYLWSNGETLKIIAGLANGRYRVTVTDSNNCSGTAFFDVAGDGTGSFIANATTGSIDCFAGSSGFIRLNPVCGTPPYTYDWSDDIYDGQSELQGLISGAYDVTITDALNAQIFETFVIEEPTDLNILNVSVWEPSCAWSCDGGVQIEVAGGTPPYTYTWDPFFGTTQNLFDACPGTYSVTVTDGNGCSAVSDDIIVNSPEPLDVQIIVNSPACNDSGELLAIATGGQPPYFYEWNNGAVGETISGLPGGDYFVVVTDANGCATERLIYLEDALILTCSSTYADCNSANGTATVSVAGGGTNLTYTWSNGGMGATQNNLEAGGYSVTVVDNDSGCRSHKNVIVEADPSCYAFISGTVYSDDNANCQPDQARGLRNIRVELSDGQVDFTNPNGYYFFRVLPGTYTINVEFDTLYFDSLCASPIVVNAPDFGGRYMENDFYFDATDIRNTGLKLSKPNPRPGFTRTVRICVMNYGAEAVNSTLTYTYDPNHEYINSNYPLTSHDTNNRQLVWDFTDHPPGRIIVVSVEMKLPATVPLGTKIDYHFLLDPIATDIRPIDNEVNCQRTVVGSYDPNDKSVEPAGRGSNGLLEFDDEQLSYLIRFQNTGTDTAFTVVLRDTLDRNVDLASVVPGPSSHPYDLTVYDSNVLEFTFNNILLPDSTTNEPASNGFVFFDIAIPDDAPPGTSIENTAAIYFDYNQPIITNTVVNTIRAATDTTRLNLSGCGELEYDGIVYTNNSIIIDTFELAIKDSIVIAELTILAEDVTDVTDTYCEGENPVPPGNYMDVLTNQYGCDSLVNREVIVLPDFEINITVPLQAGAIYKGQRYNRDTSFTETFVAANGCDSIVTTMIDILTNTQDVLLDQAALHVYPNPTTGQLYLEIKGIEKGVFQLQLLDVTGRVMSGEQAWDVRAGERREIDLSQWPNGIYTVLLRSENAVKASKIVKF